METIWVSCSFDSKREMFLEYWTKKSLSSFRKKRQMNLRETESTKIDHIDADLQNSDMDIFNSVASPMFSEGAHTCQDACLVKPSIKHKLRFSSNKRFTEILIWETQSEWNKVS